MTSVLFVCADNAGASIMAESILSCVGRSRFSAHSAGLVVAPRVNESVVDFLRSRHMPTGRLWPKNYLEYAASSAPGLDFVITVCDRAAAQTPRDWPGNPVLAHWSLEDLAERLLNPAGAGDAIRDAFWVLMRRIKIFASLPHGNAPRRSIQNRVQAISTWQ